MQALMIAHIATGAVAVVAGAVALSARKGGSVHIAGGRSFAGLMAISAASGAGLGLLNAEKFYITFHAGVLALYLIASGWLSAHLSSGRIGGAAATLGALNVANFGALIAMGILAVRAPDGAFLGFAGENYFFLAGMAGVGVIGDASLVFRRALSDRHRIARHLWRMCFGFFIAAGSAFTGPGATVFPEFIRESGVLSLPELIIIVLMLFWLVRTLFFTRRKTG
ncbi:MAG: hypothetical protein AAFW81_04350 [Pseudomonadota bacterium]